MMRRWVLAVVCGAVFWGGRSDASVIVDQQNSTGGAYIFDGLGNGRFGQSFTPTLNVINFATFDVATDAAATFRVDLYAGVGYGGSMLGQSNAAAIPFSANYYAAIATVRFDFAAPITLTPGGSYSLRLIRVAGSNTGVLAAISASNPYAGGSFLSDGGFPDTSLDFVFSEGFDTSIVAPVPEPSTLAGAGLGIALAVGAVLRRRRKVVAA